MLQQNPPLRRLLPIALGGLLVAVLVVASLAVLLYDPSGEAGNRLPENFQYDLSAFQKIDPALIRYRQAAEIPLELKQPRGIAAGREDQILVAGDRAVLIFDSHGKKISQIDLADEPRCLAVAGQDHAVPGRIYVGLKDRLAVFDAADAPPKTWETRGLKAFFTSVAPAEHDVFVADAGNKIVWRYDVQGKLLGRIGDPGPDGNIPPFIVPSPYFDVAVSPDGLLRAVNPGRFQIEAFTFDGFLEQTWGLPGLEISRFCGCCNPSALAVLPDGRIVTGEKGIARVKVYNAEGKFQCVVVGPDVLTPTPAAVAESRDEHRLLPVDLAADRQGRILVLDPAARRVRIFVEK
ncbi:MAG: NHL repeat-containing protein [Pirellulales bacterium]|nr:NHL repeat-containing protein [Pirellulales bacterium]